jgi:hypothetical protein
MLETDHLKIAKMLAAHVEALKGVGAATVAVVADNASNLRRTFDQTKERETLQSLVDSRIIDIRCFCHSLSLATTDLARIVPEFVFYRSELIALFAFVRAKKVQEFLRGMGVTGATPLIQEIKWMTWVEAGAYVGNNAVQIAEAIRYFAGNKKNPGKMPDNFVVMNSALSVLGNLLKFAQGDFVLLCHFYPRYRDCVRELQAQASSLLPMAVNPAAGLLQAIEGRAITTFDLWMAKLAFRLTWAGHREWMGDMNQILEMQTEPTDEQVAFADRFGTSLPKRRNRGMHAPVFRGCFDHSASRRSSNVVRAG